MNKTKIFAGIPISDQQLVVAEISTAFKNPCVIDATRAPHQSRKFYEGKVNSEVMRTLDEHHDLLVLVNLSYEYGGIIGLVYPDDINIEHQGFDRKRIPKPNLVIVMESGGFDESGLSWLARTETFDLSMVPRDSLAIHVNIHSGFRPVGLST